MGTAPNTSIVLTEDEINHINGRWDGRKSAAIHAALSILMGAGIDYYVRKTPNYYGGTLGAPQEHYAEDSGEIIEFTIHEAQTWIDEQEEGVYLLNHGEHARPTFEIVKISDARSDADCVDASGTVLDAFVEMAADNLPAAVKDELDGEGVDFYTDEGEYEIWTAKIDVNGIEYAIVFCPKSTSIQLYADDLSNLDWRMPAYFIDEYATRE